MKHAVIRRACSVAAVWMLFALTPAVWAIDAGILGRAWQNHPAVSVRYTLENRDVYEYDNRGSIQNRAGGEISLRIVKNEKQSQDCGHTEHYEGRPSRMHASRALPSLTRWFHVRTA